MDVLDAENEMIPIDVLRCSNFSYETPPTKSSTDKNEYSVLKLTNGLTALLISDKNDLGKEEEVDDDEEANAAYGEDEESVDEEEDNDDEANDYYVDVFGTSNNNGEIVSESSSETMFEFEELSEGDSSIGVSALEEEPFYDKERLAMAACAVCVDVGSFNDPEEMSGLAHLLEHVIGAGSRTYPGERFGSMVNELGGYFYSSTRYMFSKQLISPVLENDAIEEEIANMKFEFQTDVWCNNHVNRKLIMCGSAHKTNPAHKLVNTTQIINENIPKDTLLRHLGEFWKKNYSAHRITLVIQSKQPLKTLETWVEQVFCNIPCNNLPAEVFPPCETPFETEEFCQLFTVQPIEDENMLQISWVLPSVLKLYKFKPLHYIRWLVEQECTGSLAGYLNLKKLASQVTCNDQRSSVDFNSVYSIFSIKISLTQTGIDNLDEVCRVVFTYIKFLRESIPVKWIFNEIKTVADILFTHTLPDVWPLLNVKTLAENMRLYPPIDYIQGSHLLYDYDSNVISQLLDSMRPNKANIMITSISKSDNEKLDKVEPIFGKKYSKKSYTIEVDAEDHTAKEYFCLPSANPFIASDFSILPSPGEEKTLPEVISKSERVEAWYNLETKFQRPEGCLILKLVSPEANKSAKSFLMLEIFSMALDRVVRQEIDPALRCGYDYSLNPDENGFTIFLYGFNDKLGLLLEFVMKCIKKSESISDFISDEDFEECFETALSKSDLESKPFKLCQQMIRKIIFTPCWNYFDKLAVEKTGEPLSKSHLDTFAKMFLETSYLKCFINGNISRGQAMDMVSTMTISNKSPSERLDQKARIRVSELPQGEIYCKVLSFDKTNPYHYQINYYQYGICDTKEQCLLRLIVFIFKDYFFKHMPDDRIMFNVFSCPHEQNKKIMGILVALRSKEELDSVDVKITEYLQKFSDNGLGTGLTSVTSYERFKTSFTKTIPYEATDLMEETNIFWDEISNQVPVFDRQQKEIEAIKEINVEEIREAFKKIIDSKSNRKVSAQVEASIKISKNGENVVRTSLETSGKPKILFLDPKTNEKKAIKNMEEFKSTQILYPMID